MKNKYIIHVVHDQSPETKKDIEALMAILNNGYSVVETFNYKKEQYYILTDETHTHEKELN